MAEASQDERTEEATAHKLEQAREKGQVAYSTEATSAMGLIAGLATLLLVGGLVAQRVGFMFVDASDALVTYGELELDAQGFAEILRRFGRNTLLPLTMLVVPMALAALLVGFGQAGFRMAPKAIAADLTKLDPIKGFGRIFGRRGWVRTGLALLKIIALGAVFTITGVMQLPNLLSMGMTDIGPMMAATGRITFMCSAAIAVCVALLALLDFLFQRFQFAREQRMTKQEIKEEMKQQDGDPHVKARIRAVQREMANRRMMDDVKTAQVVVTNPTHYAVAISYPRDESGAPLHAAPVVVAKGVDFLAQNIKKVATQNGVMLHENRPLARAMYARVDIGAPIPEDLYQAVASVLAAVWRAEEREAKRLATAH